MSNKLNVRHWSVKYLDQVTNHKWKYSFCNHWGLFHNKYFFCIIYAHHLVDCSFVKISQIQLVCNCERSEFRWLWTRRWVSFISFCSSVTTDMLLRSFKILCKIIFLNWQGLFLSSRGGILSSWGIYVRLCRINFVSFVSRSYLTTVTPLRVVQINQFANRPNDATFCPDSSVYFY
jgi:hypothetical protein